MLQLKSITKDYTAGDTTVRALKEVSLSFRKTEFVSILGASGCGKTTLLNIIGGLDRYTSGDLLINGRSTKEYKDKDWDAYRNNSIGFVFQTYNLISHISVLQNVELALTLSGIGIEERKNRAIAALKEVGLEAQLNKKPNQLSGGQMQRVAIARAIVNNPEIILADEPTGALDSKTSIQIMELLKEVSQNRLVIMVTHNADLAEQYSTRIVRISDGEIVGDTAPFDADAANVIADDAAETTEAEVAEACGATEEIKEESNEVAADIAIPIEEIPLKTKKKRVKKNKKPQTSMSFLTALSLSLKNLFTKKGRTFITAFAGSIGIIGIGLVLAVSNGINGYISDMEKSFMSNSEMRIQRVAIDYTYMFDSFSENPTNNMEVSNPTFPDDGVVGVYTNNMFATMINSVTFSDINDEFKAYLKDNLSAESYNTIEYGYDISFNVVKDDLTIDVKQFHQMVSNANFVNANYDVLEGEITNDKFDVVLVVDGNNKITASTFEVLGIEERTTTLKELVGKKIKVAYNDTVYADNGSGFRYADGTTISATDRDDPEMCYELNVSAVLRMKNSAEANSFLMRGIYYNPALASYILEHESTSDIVVAQKELMESSPLNPGKLLPGVLPDHVFYKSIIDDGYITDMENFGNIEGMLGAIGQSFPISKYSLGTINADTRYNSVSIYPTSFDAKNEVINVVQEYNAGLPEGAEGVIYSDTMQLAFDTVSEITDIVTYALIAFIAISLVVSTVMIGVITYVSVVERTKEIGILRAIGARKKDISRVFNAETFIVGAMAGIIGILIAYLISIPANYILKNLTGILGLVVLNPLHAFILVVISVALTLISGLIPASIAAKKDPILCLRSE